MSTHQLHMGLVAPGQGWRHALARIRGWARPGAGQPYGYIDNDDARRVVARATAHAILAHMRDMRDAGPWLDDTEFQPVWPHHLRMLGPSAWRTNAAAGELMRDLGWSLERRDCGCAVQVSDGWTDACSELNCGARSCDPDHGDCHYCGDCVCSHSTCDHCGDCLNGGCECERCDCGALAGDCDCHTGATPTWTERAWTWGQVLATPPTTNHPRAVGIELEVAGVAEWTPRLERALERWQVSVVHDGSLEKGGFELNFRPMRGADVPAALADVCGALRAAGGRVDARCGLHVHVAARAMVGDTTAPKMRRALLDLVWRGAETHALDVLAPGRRNNQYCQCYGGLDDRSRYQTLNLSALSKHHTVEFRLWAATLDPDAIALRAGLCARLVDPLVRAPEHVLLDMYRALGRVATMAEAAEVARRAASGPQMCLPDIAGDLPADLSEAA